MLLHHFDNPAKKTLGCTISSFVILMNPTSTSFAFIFAIQFEDKKGKKGLMNQYCCTINIRNSKNTTNEDEFTTGFEFYFDFHHFLL